MSRGSARGPRMPAATWHAPSRMQWAHMKGGPAGMLHISGMVFSRRAVSSWQAIWRVWQGGRPQADAAAQQAAGLTRTQRTQHVV